MWSRAITKNFPRRPHKERLSGRTPDGKSLERSEIFSAEALTMDGQERKVQLEGRLAIGAGSLKTALQSATQHRIGNMKFPQKVLSSQIWITMSRQTTNQNNVVPWSGGRCRIWGHIMQSSLAGRLDSVQTPVIQGMSKCKNYCSLPLLLPKRSPQVDHVTLSRIEWEGVLLSFSNRKACHLNELIAA